MKEILSDSFVSMFTEEEIVAAAALTEFARRISHSVDGSCLPFPWGSKRRRSALDYPYQRRLHLLHSSPPPPPSPSLPQLIPYPPPSVETTTLVGPTTQPERPTDKAKASSPVTPLSFSPSESDEKHKRFKIKRKASVKRNREALLQITDQYEESNKLLRTEVEKLKSCMEQAMAENTFLKSRIQHQHILIGQATGNITVHQPPFVMDATASGNCSSSNGLFQASTSRLGIPHLHNVSHVQSVVGSCQSPFDDRSLVRAEAAQARRRRMQICRSKNNSKFRLFLS